MLRAIMSMLIMLVWVTCVTAAPVPGESVPPALDDFVAVDILPEMIVPVQPEYPDSAVAAGFTGRVYLALLVDKSGEVDSVIVRKSSGHSILDDSAVTAATQSRFRPATAQGKPVAIWVTVPIIFALD